MRKHIAKLTPLTLLRKHIAMLTPLIRGSGEANSKRRTILKKGWRHDEHHKNL